jgi:hypothetical protein
MSSRNILECNIEKPPSGTEWRISAFVNQDRLQRGSPEFYLYRMSLRWQSFESDKSLEPGWIESQLDVVSHSWVLLSKCFQRWIWARISCGNRRVILNWTSLAQSSIFQRTHETSSYQIGSAQALARRMPDKPQTEQQRRRWRWQSNVPWLPSPTKVSVLTREQICISFRWLNGRMFSFYICKSPYSSIRTRSNRLCFWHSLFWIHGSVR